MLTIGAIGLWLTLIAARGTPVGRLLHRWLVAMPADRLSRVERSHVLLLLVIVGIVVVATWLLAEEARVMLAFGLPDLAGLAAAIDLGTLLDVTLVAVAAASAVRVRSIVAWMRGRPAPRRPRQRTIRVRRSRPPANDDDGRPALAA
ncbi:hypothetical protein [Sphingomonas sp.]|jgi:hypothetical protein|uniref:hypothetical protein n=1 Tax=Sphingomonas sp. TaxID=28214 RepID=UPI002E34965B|nr:hypothetical protein [Sphingomonas sp.]HEX4695073.1 hypothetical protein [Sphingomonas sp.]